MIELFARNVTAPGEWRNDEIGNTKTKEAKQRISGSMPSAIAAARVAGGTGATGGGT